MNKAMNVRYYIKKLFLIGLFLSGNLYSDKDSVLSEKCKTSEFDPNNTFLTIYGDSRGDFVDQPLYGYFGWEFYLLTRKPEINWNIQNLAIGGHKTENTYNLIKECTSKDFRANFRTADNVALEIGGNDFLANSALLTYMPWKMGAVVERVTFNTRAIVRMLRNPLRNKKVLVMGNFGAVAKSPSLGDRDNYFKPYRYNPNGQITTSVGEIRKARAEIEFGDDLVNFIKNIVVNINQIYNDILTLAFKDWADEALNQLK